MVQIAPSLLSADFLKLGQELSAIEQAGVDLLHLDIMDGHFVPNISFGPLLVKAAKRGSHLFLDTHLMIDNPDRYIDEFVRAGADRIIVHVESCLHLDRTLRHIKSHGIEAGVSLNPATNQDVLAYVIDIVDVVLVMSVNPGFGGQQFLSSALTKISAIKMMAQAANKNCRIAIDGGITDATIGPCFKAGASIFIAGSHIFSSGDYQTTIQRLREAARD